MLITILFLLHLLPILGNKQETTASTDSLDQRHAKAVQIVQSHEKYAQYLEQIFGNTDTVAVRVEGMVEYDPFMVFLQDMLHLKYPEFGEIDENSPEYKQWLSLLLKERELINRRISEEQPRELIGLANDVARDTADAWLVLTPIESLAPDRGSLIVAGLFNKFSEARKAGSRMYFLVHFDSENNLVKVLSEKYIYDHATWPPSSRKDE